MKRYVGLVVAGLVCFASVSGGAAAEAQVKKVQVTKAQLQQLMQVLQQLIGMAKQRFTKLLAAGKELAIASRMGNNKHPLKFRRAAEIIANGMEILGIAWGGPTMLRSAFMFIAAGTQDAFRSTPGVINWLVKSARDAKRCARAHALLKKATAAARSGRSAGAPLLAMLADMDAEMKSAWVLPRVGWEVLVGFAEGPIPTQLGNLSALQGKTEYYGGPRPAPIIEKKTPEGKRPTLQGATNGTIGPQGAD